MPRSLASCPFRLGRSVLVLVLPLLLPFAVAEARAQGGGGTAPPVDYLGLARNYADEMLAHGRDRFGEETSPLFASMLDRSSRRPTLFDDPKRSLPSLEDYGVRNEDRAWNAGNPAHDQQLYQLLYALSRHTGDARYEQAADRALTWFFDNAQSPVTHLMAWGEHLGWNLKEERATFQSSGNQVHEMKLWDLWPQVYSLAPEPARAFALGLWNHQIDDQRTGDFSRHAFYDHHETQNNTHFPRYGGNMIVAWAHAYRNAGDPSYKAEIIEAIETVADFYTSLRDPTTGALPSQGGTNDNSYWMNNNLQMAREIGTVSDGRFLPDSTSRKLRRLAHRTDTVILRKLEHNLDDHLPPGGRTAVGFNQQAETDEYQSSVQQYLKIGGCCGKYYFSTSWQGYYGAVSTARDALFMFDRYDQTGMTGYRDLALQAADVYLEDDPDTNINLYPLPFARAIDLLVEVYRRTGRAPYLDRAEAFGRQAAEIFLDRSSPLPKMLAHDADHYETITGGDDLMLAFFHLYEARQAGADTQPPAPPRNAWVPVSPAGAGHVTLRWQTRAPFGTAFEVRRDGAVLDTTMNTTYTDVQPPSDSTPEYTVAALDGARNRSSESNAAVPGEAPPPAELATFEGEATGADRVRLTWGTRSETYNAGFQIQRRTQLGNGASASEGNWEDVGFVESRAPGGTSLDTTSYRFIDDVFDLPFETTHLTYRLRQVYRDSSIYHQDRTGTPVLGRRRIEVPHSQSFVLKENFPNPFRQQTTLRYRLPEETKVNLDIYDGLGRTVRTLVDERQAAGPYEVRFYAGGLASGVYFVHLEAGERVTNRRVVLVR